MTAGVLPTRCEGCKNPDQPPRWTTDPSALETRTVPLTLNARDRRYLRKLRIAAT